MPSLASSATTVMKEHEGVLPFGIVVFGNKQPILQSLTIGTGESARFVLIKEAALGSDRLCLSVSDRRAHDRRLGTEDAESAFDRLLIEASAERDFEPFFLAVNVTEAKRIPLRLQFFQRRRFSFDQVFDRARQIGLNHE